MMVERERLRLTLVVIQTLLADVVDDTDAPTPHVAPAGRALPHALGQFWQ